MLDHEEYKQAINEKDKLEIRWGKHMDNLNKKKAEWYDIAMTRLPTRTDSCFVCRVPIQSAYKEHLVSEEHKHVIAIDENYLEIDKLINELDEKESDSQILCKKSKKGLKGKVRPVHTNQADDIDILAQLTSTLNPAD